MKVNGEGDYHAKIWLLGEAPGRQEDTLGRPFVGGAGLVLDGLLRKGGLQRRDCYVDNVIQERPADNDFGCYYMDKGRYSPNSILLDAHTRIKTLISTHRPNLVVCLGNEALFAVTGHKGILNWSASIIEKVPLVAIPMASIRGQPIGTEI